MSAAVMRRAARVTTTCAKPWLSSSTASRMMPAPRAASTAAAKPVRSVQTRGQPSAKTTSTPEAAARSNTSVCLRITDPAVAALDDAGQRDFVKKLTKMLETEEAALDIGGYRDAPAGLRIWCGATVDSADIEALGPWLDWAYATAKAAA